MDPDNHLIRRFSSWS